MGGITRTPFFNTFKMKRGYARVSTDSQELGRQIDALQRSGCEIIYTDTMSGTKKSRPELDRMLSELCPGDTVVIQKLDRLGRSMIHLLEMMETFKQKQVSFVSLSESFDTTTPHGTMMFTMLGAFAQFERDMIAERTRNALRYKQSQGVRLGAPRKLKPGIDAVIREEYERGVRVVEIARRHGVSERTIYNTIK